MKTERHIIFRTISDKEWKAFRLACLKNGEPMTQVLIRAIREYLKGGKEK